MRQTPVLKPLPRPTPRPLLTGSRIWLVGLGALALVLLGLISRDTIFAKPAAAPLRLATVTRGTVKAQVSGTGSLVPAGQENVNFRVAGQINEIDVKVGDLVTTGQLLARLDSSTQQAALSQAQASLAAAQASLQAAQTPLTSAQVAQLQHAVAAAQQNYADTVNSVNAQNDADAAAVTADQQRYTADRCGTGTAAPACAQDQAQLTADQSRQHLDQLSGQARVDQAAVQVTSAQDNLTVQTQAKPNAIASARAQVAAASSQVASAQVALNQTTLTAPMSGVVISVNGQVGEMAPAGSGTTAQAPGTTAPQPASSSSSAGASAFMVITDTSSFQAVIPFAETDAARLQSSQDASLTFDAIPGLTISGHVLGVAPSATIVSSVVNYYATSFSTARIPACAAG